MSEKLDLTRFEKKMVIRNIEEKDIDKIIDLQKDCFPGMEPWKREHLISHLEHFPKDSFVQNSKVKLSVRAQVS